MPSNPTITTPTEAPTEPRTTQLTNPTHHFAMRFTSARRGARLARRLCGVRLDAWGIPCDSDAHDALALIAAELCVNAVRHGTVPGRDFHLRITARDRTVRLEVTDTRGERIPVLTPHGTPADRTDGHLPASRRRGSLQESEDPGVNWALCASVDGAYPDYRSPTE